MILERNIYCLNMSSPLLVSLCYNVLTFIFYKNRKPALSIKQLSHILSCKTSLFMSLVSTYFNYNLYQVNYDIQYLQTNTLLQSLSNYSSYFFLSYLICDLVLGTIYYKSQMGILTGYIHHIVYIMITFLAFHRSETFYYTLFFIEEIPTFILSLGSIDPNYRSNMLFGGTFFVFRIGYHTMLMYLLRYNLIFMILGCSTLMLHTYWFKIWINKYLL